METNAAYEFTGNSICPEQLYDRIIAILKRSYDIGLTIRAIVSDMGRPQNRSLWKLLNIVAGEHSKIQNFINHPCEENEKNLSHQMRSMFFKIFIVP